MGTVLTTLGSGKKGNGVPLAVTLKRKKRYRRDGKGLTDVHKTPPGKPQRGTSGSGCAKNREVGEQFKDAQQALTTALEENVRSASLYWFQNAIITENTADQLTISVGNDQVGFVQEQYSGLLGKLMNKKVILRR